jgi:hypothetical protein
MSRASQAAFGVRLAVAALLGALLAVVVVACGGAGRAAKATASGSVPTATALVVPPSTTSSTIPPGQSVRGDADADNPSDIDGNGDSDAASVGGADSDNDNPTPQSYRFPDSDDGPSFAFGHAANAATRHAVEEVVKRYYAAGAVNDGAKACPLLQPGLARSLPESYAGPLAPSYMRGAKTCAAVLSLLFAHDHPPLEGAIRLFAVRVAGASARAIFGSRTAPASSVLLTREGDAWWLVEVLAQPLP